MRWPARLLPQILLSSLLLGMPFIAVAKRNLFDGLEIHPRIQRAGTISPVNSSTSNVGGASDSLITPKLVASIPPRVTDASGHQADVVNVLIVGSEDELKLAFEAAQWTMVGRTKIQNEKGTSVQNLSDRAFLDLPLPELFLFGKPQDYGFVYPEPVTIYQTRRYLRLWKAPFKVSNRTLWIGTAAHDYGPWWNNQFDEIINQPNPNVDAERTFVGESLNSTGLVTKLDYVRSSAGPTTAGPIRTDGRIIVLMLMNLPAK